jgi:hypothetical protein
MAAEIKKEIELEIAHVLFTDIVGYSKLPIHQQRAVVERLNEIVRGTDEFQAAETAGRLIKIPTGDGITLVFYHSPEAPVECALEISRALKEVSGGSAANGHTQRTREWGHRRNRKSERSWRRHQYGTAGHGLRRCRTHFALEARR